MLNDTNASADVQPEPISLLDPFGLLGFAKRSHHGRKVNDGGIWEGEYILTCSNPINNERETERDLETILLSTEIGAFGESIVLLTFIRFNWTPTRDELDVYGEGIHCIVTVGYQRRAVALDGNEQRARLTRLKEREQAFTSVPPAADQDEQGDYPAGFAARVSRAESNADEYQ